MRSLGFKRPLSHSAFAVAALLTCCQDGTDRVCADGTQEADGDCVSAFVCGQGTQLENGRCVAVETSTVCSGRLAPDEDGVECVLSEDACERPTQLDVVTGRCVAPDDVQCGSGTERSGPVCVPACTGDFEIPNAQRNGCAAATRVQIVHASADPAVASLDVYSRGELLIGGNGEVIGDDLTFTEATEVLKLGVTSELPLRFADADSADDSSPLFELRREEVSPGVAHLVVVRGVQDPSQFDTSVNDSDSVALGVTVYSGLTEEPVSSSDVQFSVVHTVTDAATLNVSIVDETREVPLTNESFGSGEALSYSNGVGGGTPIVPSGLSTLRFFVGDGSTLDREFRTSSESLFPAASGVSPGTIGVLVAAGFADIGSNVGAGDQNSSGFRVIAVLPDGAAESLEEVQ